MMKHCLRYMIGRHCCAWEYDFPKRHCEVMTLTDAGWASGGEQRRYVDWMHVYQSGDLIELSTSIHQPTSFFTAESEFYGIVRGAASGIQFQETFVQSGLLVRFWVLSDSSMTRSMTARIGSGQVEHLEVHIWVCDCVRKKQFSMESIDTFCNLVDLGMKFHAGESLGILMEMLTIVVDKLELTELTEKLLERLFLASQATRMQDNDENYEELTLYYRVLVLVYILGLVSGVLMMVLVYFVVNHTCGGRYAESRVNCVEVGTQVDLLAYVEQLNEELIHDLNSQLLQPKLGESLHVFLGIWT